MKNRIYIKDWLKFKPYNIDATTDSYYLTVCNEVLDVFYNDENALMLHRLMDEDKIKDLACFLTSYFEDLISELNIWNTFINEHKRLYGKFLPFYDLKEYYEGEINEQDISFLMWYFINVFEENLLIEPSNNFFINLAETIWQVFDAHWEYAPENEHILKYYQFNDQESNFINAGKFLICLLTKTYLFYPDTVFELERLTQELLNDIEFKEHADKFLYENTINYVFKKHTALLAFSSKEWASLILGGKNQASTDFNNLSPRIRGFFLFKGKDDKYIYLEHIGSDKKFSVIKESFSQHVTLKEIDTIVNLGLVCWKREWWFSGVSFQFDYSEEIISKESNSFESKLAVSFLDDKEEEENILINEQHKSFRLFNNDYDIKFLKTSELNQFMNDFTNFHNQQISSNTNDLYKTQPPKSKINIDFPEEFETALVFFNKKSSLEIAYDINSAFPLENNPYFNNEKSEDDILILLTSKDISTELALYCINNCSKNLPFFKEPIGKLYLENIDFLLRFWKKEEYKTKLRNILVS